jgi:ATP-dependent Clp protease ATP-binding subunit ClpA
MLFYGPSGIGKTETAQLLAKEMQGELFRRQFSMYQNNEFATYLFGGTYYQGSFAKDLLDRESNVILLDEFDKANPIFHSAFYQLFDEGVYEDQNYKVNVEKAIIICTSNYSSKEEVKEKLGEAIYYRFDAVIGFKKLDIQSKRILVERYISQYDKNLLTEEQEANLINGALKCENVRSIKKLVRDTISMVSLRKILN